VCSGVVRGIKTEAHEKFMQRISKDTKIIICEKLKTSMNNQVRLGMKIWQILYVNLIILHHNVLNIYI